MSRHYSHRRSHRSSASQPGHRLLAVVLAVVMALSAGGATVTPATIYAAAPPPGPVEDSAVGENADELAVADAAAGAAAVDGQAVHDHATHDHGARAGPTIDPATEFDPTAKVVRGKYPGSVSAPNGLEPLDWASAEGHGHGGDGHGGDGERAPQVLAADGERCSATASSKTFDVVAINVDIPLNRYGDHDPEGRMFVLRENLDDVRAQEGMDPSNPDRVQFGLKDDPIQPLVVRANMGECVTVRLENRLQGEHASFHVHRGSVTGDDAGSNVGNNPSSLVAPGDSRTYTFRIPNGERYEGVWYFHSHGNARTQTSHGLFGALVVEHPGSRYLDPETREPLKSGWEAIVVDGSGVPAEYREYVIIYHEIGNDDYQPLDASGDEIPLVDPLTDTYRPCTKALNYRTECFLNRMDLLQSTDDIPKGSDLDKGLAYSSYTFGDPSTPMPRAYVGDPSKIHTVHGGSEQFHSHHLHGGGVRWRFDPHTDSHAGHALTQRGGDDAVKDPPADDVNAESHRLDSQTLGPGETFTQEIACGAGGCQRSVGDFLFHCHIPDHYFAGMWSIWRVHNTEQDDLAELSGQDAPVAVDSTELLGAELPSGRTLDTPAAVEEWVESSLPPQGVRDGYDATVYDWKKEETADGPRYLKEPEDAHVWPGFEAENPGEREPILFDPTTGRPAYPLLSPHLGARPPFAPGVHGPAPYLRTPPDSASDVVQNRPLDEEVRTAPDPERPEDAICPAGSRVRRYNVVAVQTDARLNDDGDVMDDAMLYVLADEKEAVLNGDKPAEPLVYRANVGDCVMLTLTSELPDAESNHHFSTVNIHPHFVQFDVQASGGVDTGFGYERTIRPYATEDRTLVEGVSAGDTVLSVTRTEGLHEGIWIGVGLGTNEVEFQRVAAIDEEAGTVTLEEPLVRDHAADDAVGVEFVRYGYYVDANLGSVYFHDHVNALHTWPKGLYGTLVVEPEGSEWRDPETGEPVRSGPVADIHTDRPVVASAGAKSFRELVLLFGTNRFDEQDVGEVTGTVNLRAEPLAPRIGREGPAAALRSTVHGDPSTPLLRAYEGDPVMVRTVNGATIGRFPFRLTGHEFLNEHTDGASARDAVLVDISEQQDLWVRGGAGKPGDYLWYVAQADHFERGMWGIVRVHGDRRADLQPLPDRGVPPDAGPGDATRDACPADAPVRQFDVVAVPVDVDGPEGDVEKAFVLAEDAAAAERGETVEPLVLRAAAGDCVEVTLRNDLDERTSLHLGRLTVDPKRSLGISVGTNPDQSVAPGASRTYRGYVGSAFGAALVADFAQLDDELEGQRDGLYGALVAAPEGSRFFDPETGAEVSAGADVVVASPGETYRDAVLLFHAEEDRLGTPVMPYRTEARGKTLVNYRAEPITDTERGKDPATAYSSRVHGDPSTPLVRAYEDDPVRIHALQGYGLQEGVFSLSGHGWQRHPDVARSTVVSAGHLAPHLGVEAHLVGGAGPPGDYLWLNQRLPYAEAGQWGLFRVHGEPRADLLPLDEIDARADATPPDADDGSGADDGSNVDDGSGAGDGDGVEDGAPDTGDGGDGATGGDGAADGDADAMPPLAMTEPQAAMAPTAQTAPTTARPVTTSLRPRRSGRSRSSGWVRRRPTRSASPATA